MIPSDSLPKVQALAKEAWLSGHGHLFDQQEIALIKAASDDSIFTTSWVVPKTGVTFLAFDGATMVGAATLRPFPNEAGRPALVEPMDVRVGHQRHGIGRALWDYLRWISRRRGDARIDVYALDGNAMAMGFYTKMGGQVVGAAELRLGAHVEPATRFLFKS
jgi:GNAT superfamily N-acetyltransferase